MEERCDRTDIQKNMSSTLEQFSLQDRVCVITGGAGFLGRKHAEAILDAGGIPILLDINEPLLKDAKTELATKYNQEIAGFIVDIADLDAMARVRKEIIEQHQKVDVLINNAANNPKVEGSTQSWTHLEHFPGAVWEADLRVGLRGSFIASQIFGTFMAEQGKGVILNISSDLGIIAPDQRIYRKEGIAEEEQMVKPVTYSVVKHGLIGLTRYCATYWADQGVRVNAICPGGVFNGQDDAFIKKLSALIPLGRMAFPDEYKATILFLISEASSYMTGSVVIIDGGRTCW